MDTLEEVLENGTALSPVSSVSDLKIDDKELEYNQVYYVNVIVEDLDGNRSVYQKTKVNFERDFSFLEIDISIETPGEEGITFNQSNFLFVSSGEPLSISVQNDYDKYEWYLDGIRISGMNSHSIILTKDVHSKLNLSVHTITVVVYKDDTPYSSDYKFILTSN